MCIYLDDLQQFNVNYLDSSVIYFRVAMILAGIRELSAGSSNLKRHTGCLRLSDELRADKRRSLLSHLPSSRPQGKTGSDGPGGRGLHVLGSLQMLRTPSSTRSPPTAGRPLASTRVKASPTSGRRPLRAWRPPSSPVAAARQRSGGRPPVHSRQGARRRPASPPSDLPAAVVPHLSVRVLDRQPRRSGKDLAICGTNWRPGLA